MAEADPEAFDPVQSALDLISLLEPVEEHLVPETELPNITRAALLQKIFDEPERDPFLIQQISKTAKPLAELVMRSYFLLRGVLERHEATIRKRWVKKTARERRRLLQSIWPDIPTKHRPDADAHTRNCKNTNGKKVPDIDKAFYVPYINIEDLVSEAQNLLIFLNARGRHHPETFALSELEFSPFQRKNHAKLFLRYPGKLMIFCGSIDPTAYGKIDKYR
ncbi:hypothetical protein BDV96DRAFT_652617 [Lophiotrema nucula]|uniref:Uncharacterized protein n=1 Tax=Lophiotrema nucula TaxID=690887 RepID=A0A6A5YN24_9PLEO|nr:hypothetical protein BDV96DRAFT_652617 [Lophiotrema nucula]